MHLADDAWADDLLTPISPGGANELRQRIWEQTRPVLHWRRWRPRLVLASACAVCILAGVLLGRLSTPAISEVSQPRANQMENPAPVEKPAPTPPVTAQALESLAFDTFAQKDRAARYIQAGHRYLEEELDPESALRCYRQALEVAAAGDMEISPNDTWLLKSLKTARHKEKTNEQVLP